MMKASNVANVPTGKQSECTQNYVLCLYIYIYMFVRCAGAQGCGWTKCFCYSVSDCTLNILYVTYVQCFCLDLVCKIMNTTFVFVEHRCTSHCWQPPVITSG